MVIAVFLIYLFNQERDIPRLYLLKFGESIPFHHKTDLYGSYISNTDSVDHIYIESIKAKARGGGNADFPKRNFSLELDSKIPFCGLKKDDDWILNASFREKSFIRHSLSFDLFRQMNSNHIAPHTSHLEVYRNFKYNGLYVVIEKLDAKRLGIKKNDNTAFAFKEPPILLHPDTFLNSNPRRDDDINHQIFPNIDKVNKNHLMDSLRNFIHLSSDVQFNEKIFEYFEMNEIIDWHLLLLFTHNGDGVVKGFILFKPKEQSKYRIAIWDYDHTFGRDTDGERHYPGIIDWKRSPLFKRLMENNTKGYRDKLIRRYKELKANNAFDSNRLISQVDQYSKQLYSHAKLNESKWTVNHPIFYDSANFEDEIQLIKSWIPEQLDSLDRMFERF